MASAKQRAASKRNIKKAQAAKAAKAGRKGGKKTKTLKAGAGIGKTRKKGTVIGYVARKPGKLYYVTGNGAVVETICKNHGCRKKKPKLSAKQVTKLNRR
jgi:hypothetical protein